MQVWIAFLLVCRGALFCPAVHSSRHTSGIACVSLPPALGTSGIIVVRQWSECKLHGAQGHVDVVVSVAISEHLYTTKLFEVELVVYVESSLGAGLGRYDRHSRTNTSFHVKCLTAAGPRYTSD